ncbi:putative tRNA synthetases class I [Serinicoccus hydrothermalis]|uniref:Putative tRNA synthetases class I n=1 Tax=Serinicoccus hydrothermalis TaxID=1758689 RepID=A0A1B1NGH0_9MICO|nr:2TM domain-containing protein [Serinicoccus hydrothermalis]ANS80526.1 putative tRNA synthetases class I [Serinicoccus hydrothermalis]
MSQPPQGPTDPVEGNFPLQPYRPSTELDPEMRKRALAKIEARQEWRQHFMMYALIMGLLTLIWLVSGGFGEYFWPIWPMMGWGIGVAIHGASLTFDREPTEKEIAEEAAKLRKRLGRPDHPED